jgi:hypothetical protein
MSDDGSWPGWFRKTSEWQAVGGLADGALQGELSTPSITGMQAPRLHPGGDSGSDWKATKQGTTTIEARETHQAPCMALAESGEPRTPAADAGSERVEKKMEKRVTKGADCVREMEGKDVTAGKDSPVPSLVPRSGQASRNGRSWTRSSQPELSIVPGLLR